MEEIVKEIRPRTMYRSYMEEVLKLMKIGRDHPDFTEKAPEKLLMMLDKAWKKEDKEITAYLDKFKVS